MKSVKKCGPLTETWGTPLEMAGNDAAEHKEVAELKWERKRGLSWDKMSKEGSEQIK